MARIIDAFTQFFDNSSNPLVNGKLRFLESGTSNTDKTTFKDAAMTAGLENTNPVILDGAGRLAFSVFGSGVYNVILFTSDDVQIQQFDPVGASSSGAQFDAWDASQTYDMGDIVRGSDGEYYQSFTNANTNNNPTVSPTQWDLITIVKSYIADASGTADVITADFTPVIHSLVNNTRVTVTASGANASTVPTFAPNGLTAKIIVKSGNQPLLAGDIGGSGFQMDMIYRSGIDKWELMNASSTNYLAKSPSATEDNLIIFSSTGGAQDSLVQLQREANAGGTADVLTATFSPTLPSPLVDKVQVKVRALLANTTTTPTFEGDTITKNGGQTLSPGDISGLGHILIMAYDLANTNWELLNPATVLQVQVAASSTLVTTTNSMGLDNTVPQSTEGVEFMTVSITPKSAGSSIIVLVDLFGGTVFSVPFSGAIFKDTDTDAIYASTTQQSNADSGSAVKFSMVARFDSVDTTARTYKLRLGPSSGAQTLSINGRASGELFGAINTATMVVMEVG